MCDHGHGFDGGTVTCGRLVAGTGGKQRAAGQNRRLGWRWGAWLMSKAGQTNGRADGQADGPNSRIWLVVINEDCCTR